MNENEYPLWLGSARPSVVSVPVWSEVRDHALHRMAIEGGRPIILIARNSGSAGRAGAREAAKNAHEAAYGLARRTGLDITKLLPDIEEIVDYLMQSPNVVKSRDANGRVFKNRFCLLDYSEFGVILSVSTGSAHKVDSDLNQPHVRWIQRLMRELSPAGFFATQFNRVSRVLWQTGLLVEELKALEARAGSVWACDDQYGMWSTADDAGVLHALRGQQASTEAKEFRRKATGAQVRLAGEEMIDGQVKYTLATGIPPGLFVFRDRRSGRMVLSIDSPGYYPEQDDVVYGLPRVVDADGELVDQAENVRWLLREYARSGVTRQDVFQGLLERRYSTQWLRNLREQGPTAYYGCETYPVSAGDGGAYHSWMRAIFANLDLYETGVLRRTVGPEDDQQITITEVFPDAGLWATPEEFRAIRAKMADEDKRSEGYTSWSWSGVPIVVDGVAGELRPRQVNSSDDVAWHPYVGVQRFHADRVGVEDESQDGGVRSAGRVSVPAMSDRLMTDAIVEALIAARGKPLMRHLAAEKVTDEAEVSQRELDQLLAEVEAQKTKLERCASAAFSGEISGGLLARVQAEHEGIEEVLAVLNRKVEATTRRVEALGASRVGLNVTAMSLLVAGLRDPHTNKHRADLRDAVSGLTATTTQIRRHKLKGTEVRVSGLLVFDDEGTAYELPFGFSYRTGTAFDVDRRALEALRALRQGQVARYATEDNQGRTVSARVAEMLGVPSTVFAVRSCNDPMLLKLGMAAMFPSPVQGEDPADVISVSELCADQAFRDDFGDVAELAERITSLFSTYRGHQWLRLPGGRIEATALIKMATLGALTPTDSAEEDRLIKVLAVSLRRGNRRHRWTFHQGFWPVLSPCSFCGSTAAGTMRIGEVTGYLCLSADCRRDEAGVRWPARFDQYISHPDDWQAAGVHLTLPEGFDGYARSMTGTVPARVVKESVWRPLTEIDEAERAAIVAAYADRARVVKEIGATFRIRPKTLYAIVGTAQNVAPRNAGKARFHLQSDDGDRVGVRNP